MADGWLEPRTRIPFVGIIAIVIIVAVVAVFLKTQLTPFFPQSEVTVQAAGEKNVAGSASASFYGMREITLKPKEYLQGTMSTPARSLKFTVDVPGRLLTIQQSDAREEVELQMDGERLTATFEYDDVQTRVDVDATGRYLLFSEPGKSVEPAKVALSDLSTYRGLFTVRNKQYLFQFSPAADQALISGAKVSTVGLTRDGNKYTGVWSENGKNHPVTVDMESGLATVEELY